MSQWLEYITGDQKRLVIAILIALLAFSLYSHYRTSSSFARACNLVGDLKSGFVDIEAIAESPESYQPAPFDVDALARELENHERLMSADTPEGREYRWRLFSERELEALCAQSRA